MTISHHVNEELLYQYAAGELDYVWSLAVATHLAMCPTCRKQVRFYEDALALSLVEEEVADVSISADDVLESIMGTDSSITTLQPKTSKQPLFPEPLRSLSGDLDEIKWSTMGGGIRQKIIYEDENQIARLLYIPAGVAASSHGHNGVELTQVVIGGFYDGDQAFNTGDIQIVGHESPHQPIAMKGGPCICLAVTDAPLRFQNILPRLFQGLFKI